jgi:hypothetical protein
MASTGRIFVVARFPIASMAALRVEVDSHDLDRNAGRLNRSVREDGAHAESLNFKT